MLQICNPLSAASLPAQHHHALPGRFLEALRAHADTLVASGSRVLLVGDFNMAAGPQDVHPKAATYDTMYSERERGAFAVLLEGYADAWRARNPDASDVFTVWDEYTAARPFNHVRVKKKMLMVMCTAAVLYTCGCWVIGGSALDVFVTKGSALDVSASCRPRLQPPCHREFALIMHCTPSTWPTK